MDPTLFELRGMTRVVLIKTVAVAGAAPGGALRGLGRAILLAQARRQAAGRQLVWALVLLHEGATWYLADAALPIEADRLDGERLAHVAHASRAPTLAHALAS